MDPWQISASGSSEHIQQVAFFAWAKKAEIVGFDLAWQPATYRTHPPREALQPVPALKLLHAIPNGGDRNKAVAGRLKAEGVRSGVLDTFLPWPGKYGAGLYIEFKVPGNQPSPAQRTFAELVQRGGYGAFLAYDWESAARLVEAHLAVS